ncbi:MAG TPA: response regulator [Polyangia bacterium]|nr:response regulator [Polyangia bacterium]
MLIVEDDEELRDLIGDLLEEEGYDVIPATNGKQALDYLRSTRRLPLLILLDLMMPLVNGWELLRTIKSDPWFSALPVVVMTAVKRDRPSGASAVLKKPFKIAELLDVVLDIVGPRGVPGAPGWCI